MDEFLNIGASVARTKIINESYRNEDYIFLTHSHIIPSKNWDQTLITSLDYAYGTGAHLISQVPAEVTSSRWSAHEKCPPTFPVMDPRSSAEKMPIFKSRFFNVGNIMYETPIASTKCLFGDAKFLIDQLMFFKFPLPALLYDEDSLVLSLLCHIHGALIMNPKYSVLFHVRKDTQKNRKLNEKLLKFKKSFFGCIFESGRKNEINCDILNLFRKKSYQAFWEKIGFDPKNGGIRGCNILGVHLTENQQEIIDKYGSKKKYDSFKRKFCITL